MRAKVSSDSPNFVETIEAIIDAWVRNNGEPKANTWVHLDGTVGTKKYGDVDFTIYLGGKK